MSRLLSILLQKSDPNYPWGFAIVGGRDCGFPITIDKVTPGTLASQYLASGDRIIKIDNLDTSQLRQSEADVIIGRPSKCIDLLVLKCDGDDSECVRKSDSSASRKSRSFYNDSNRVRERLQNAKASSSESSSMYSHTERESSLRMRKRLFWDKCSHDSTDYSFGKGLSRMSEFVNGPTKDRTSRKNEWRRCVSEERSQFLSDDCLSPNSSDSQEFRSRPTHNVWSPPPTRKEQFRFKSEKCNEITSEDRSTFSDNVSESLSSFYNKRGPISVNTESPSNQSYVVNSDLSTPKSEPFSPKSEQFSVKSEPFSPNSESLSTKSDQFYVKSEQSSPKSDAFPTESKFSYEPSPLKKPSDFWDNGKRTIPKTSNCFWNNINTLKKSSEFKRSISLCERSYSSNDKSKNYEKIEKLNESKHLETSSSNDGKEERFEKSEKRKELVVSENDGDSETQKIVNDFKSVERKTGDKETCNKIKTHSEECTTSAMPSEFSNDSRRNITPREPHRAETCSHKLEVDKEVQNVEQKVLVPVKVEQVYDKEDVQSLVSMSSINETDSEKKIKVEVKSKDIFSSDKQWTSSTPIPQNNVDVIDSSTVKTEVQEQQKCTNQEIIRQQNQISGGGGSPGPGSPQGDIGVVAPPPPPPPPSGPPVSCPPAPPPPPPPGSGALPTVRLSSEIPDRKKGGYEPPAAIQNAMMTKDKKPFTYTPGGLDLSEIRSPRMARRINRNANAPDSSVPQPRPSPLANQPLPPSAMAAMQPQIAIPVFPQGGSSPQLHHVGAQGHYASPPPPPPPGQHFNAPQTSPPVQPSPPPPPPPVQKFAPPTYNQPSPPAMQKSPQTTYSQPSPPPMSVPKSQPQNRSFKQEQSPGSIYIPPIESQQPRAQLGSLYIPPIAQEETKPAVQSPVQLNKAPTPWLSRSQSQREKEVPPWVNREENIPSQPTSQPSSTQAQTRIIPIQIEGREQTSTPTNTRIIPIQIEGSNSPVQNIQPNYQQQNQPQRQQSMYQQSSAPSTYQQQPSPQQQWQQQQYQQPPQQQWQQQQYQQPPPPPQQQQQQQQRWKNQQPVYVHNKFNTGSQSPAPGANDQVDNPKQLQSQQSWGQTAANGTGIAPVQSRSFRVLQKITDTADGTQSGVDQTDAPYNSQGVPLSQLRKLQLSDDDRALMNKVKTQVDEETYLHNESDPRYRGSSIPSRAFRILQTMTGEGEEKEVPRTAAQNQVGQNRLGQGQSQSESPQPYIPPSEQQVQEPRKYTGSAIPSRSFRMLQAMTAGSDSSDRPGESEY